MSRFYGEDGFTPPKYWFYREFMQFMHKHGWHYAPKKYPPQPHKPRVGLDGRPIKEWYHWCEWCGLRGTTIDVNPPQRHK